MKARCFTNTFNFDLQEVAAAIKRWFMIHSPWMPNKHNHQSQDLPCSSQSAQDLNDTLGPPKGIWNIKTCGSCIWTTMLQSNDGLRASHPECPDDTTMELGKQRKWIWSPMWQSATERSDFIEFGLAQRCNTKHVYCNVLFRNSSCLSWEHDVKSRKFTWSFSWKSLKDLILVALATRQ